jgi:hypothetical protein
MAKKVFLLWDKNHPSGAEPWCVVADSAGQAETLLVSQCFRNGTMPEIQKIECAHTIDAGA